MDPIQLFLLAAAAAFAVFGTEAFAREIIGNVVQEGRMFLEFVQREIRRRKGRIIIHTLSWVLAALTITGGAALFQYQDVKSTEEVTDRLLAAIFWWVVSYATILWLIWIQRAAYTTYRRDADGSLRRYPAWMTNEDENVLDQDGNEADVNGHLVTLNDDGEPVANGAVVTAQADLDRFQPHRWAGQPEVETTGFNPDQARFGWSMGVAFTALILCGGSLLRLGAEANSMPLSVLGTVNLLLAVAPIALAGRVLKGLAPQEGRLRQFAVVVADMPNWVLTNICTLCAWVILYPSTGTLDIVGTVLLLAALLYFVAAQRGEVLRVERWLRRTAVGQALVVVPLGAIHMFWKHIPNDGIYGVFKTTMGEWGVAPLNVVTGQTTAEVAKTYGDIVWPLIIAFGLALVIAAVAKWILGAGRMQKVAYGIAAFAFLVSIFHGWEWYSKASGKKTMGFPKYASTIAAPTAAPSDLVAIWRDGRVRLQWKETSEDETRFVIERRTDRTTFAPIDHTEANTAEYIDKDIRFGTTFCYRVVAANDGGISPFSNDVCITTPAPIIGTIRQVAPPATSTSGVPAPAPTPPTPPRHTGSAKPRKEPSLEHVPGQPARNAFRDMMAEKRK